MTHEQSLDSLGAWLDGELTPQASAMVAEHVGACATCRAAAEAIRGLGSTLRALPRHEIPPDLRARLLRPEAAAPARAAWRRPWALASIASVAAAAIIVIGVIGLRRPDAPRVASLDRNEEKSLERLGYVGEDREQPPAQESEPAAPQPTRADRFALAPPAAPDDRPVMRDEDAAASAPAEDARAEAGKLRATISSETAPAEELKKPATDQEKGERAQLAAPSHTYVARLVVDSAGAYHLEQVVPPPAATGIKEEAAKDSVAGMAAAAPSEGAAGAPAAARENDSPPLPTTAALPPAAAQLMFLVELDAEGKIIAARLVGARTTSSEVAETARALLIGSRFPGQAMGRLTHATVQVLVDDPALQR